MRKSQKKKMLALFRLCESELQMCGADCAAHLNNIETHLHQMQKLALGEKESLNVLLDECISLLMEANGNGSILNALRQKLEETGLLIEREKVNKKLEVVFFPYKVAMSDSLKTIYLAAKEDPSCDAYWCPIPYYDRNADHSLGKMYYEGDNYSDEFEITNWREYDVENRRPDIIFTHYAYDECNYVTTIHPLYYSSRLKNFTNLLVYIDYGLTMWVWRRWPKEWSEVGYFTPAYWNSDLIVTYSKEFANVLALHMKWIGKLNDEASKRAASKIVPLGSAKFDVVLRAKREDFAMPKEWRDIIHGRRIVLYNTSLHGLLKESDVFLKEIIEVIEAALKNEDVVLWWRPHPLMENTLRTMRPELVRGIHEIVETFKEQKWGIYDETDDLHRAISWSDACLTNESSLVWLYLASGKPFTVLNDNWRLQSPQFDDGEDFTAPLRCRINNMRAGSGANPYPDSDDWNWCVWWPNFSTEDYLHNIHYNHFLDRFFHFVVHRDVYPEAEEYQKLQLQILHDFVENADGTAGDKIYDFCRQRAMLKTGNM